MLWIMIIIFTGKGNERPESFSNTIRDSCYDERMDKKLKELLDHEMKENQYDKVSKNAK